MSANRKEAKKTKSQTNSTISSATAAGKRKPSKPIIARATRFQPDPMTLAYFSFDSTDSFEPTLVGIVINESFSGCAVLVATDGAIKNGQALVIKIGNLDPMPGEIAWIKPLEENIKKLGVKLLV